MARWATGVSVVTAHGGAGDFGLTVNAFLSVSLAPPQLLVSLSHDADTTPVVAESGRFTVNLLTEAQRPVSERFAKAIPGPEKFAGLPFERGRGEVLRLTGALASLECRVAGAFDVADHRLVVGEVDGLEVGPEARPLLFFQSRYAGVAPGRSLERPG
jgi:3-hydroxy-9,10-secoandrosta-1,3,5(10)-triene-9,17-dione monooxygenase reductase component